MSFTIQLGWWLVPALMTIATAVYGALPGASSTYGDWAGAFRLMAAMIFTLSAWLVWSLLA